MKESLPQIVIVDDHDLFRDGVKTLLELNSVGQVIAEASDGLEFIDTLKQGTPDIVLMDIEMPNMNGIEALQKAMEITPSLKVLVISMFTDHQYYYDIMTSGAKGFIFKTANKDELINAIKSVLKGGTYFSSSLLQEMIIKYQNEKNENNTKEEVQLNEKEIEIISFMVDGLSAKEIAEKTHLSPKTVSNYKTLMLEKTGCKNAVSLVVYAIKHQLIEI
ncbi:response regulator transcription factor [Carboxylicivirga linearis]|uniref:Response regulator transcription factor n=1 Tax=Carboxylicivirga linearis TaxID=1628157 RepID=A0ABS5JQG4_9BACT|nr:response regulator transcription factor [Carboxylicivirga linearis]MBS2097080.1 response regulator transcription factor [Carboxylicivirga linearis]